MYTENLKQLVVVNYLGINVKRHEENNKFCKSVWMERFELSIQENQKLTKRM